MTVHDATKPALREHYRELRRSLTHHQIDAAGRIITERLKDAVDWSKVKAIHVYEALQPDNEVPTRRLLDWLATEHPDVKIYQPAQHARMASELPKVDVIIVPIVAFDSRGHRLGWGGGTYDRWLAQTTATKVGLAYEICRTPGPLPAEPHDQTLDLIVTDQQIHKY